jgi:CheY-like chemotaxis protein
MAGTPGHDAGRPSLVTRHSIQETHHAVAILLAEDNKTNQQVAGAMLRKRGHRVDIVDNGRQAVEAVRKSQYDVVLMDLQMPELDGFGATREIRQFLNGRLLPIVAVTANVIGGERERCLAEGMDGYLAKPFRAHELFAIVEGWNDGVEEVARPAEDLQPAVDVAGFRAAMREAGVEEMVGEVLATFRGESRGRMVELAAAAAARDATGITEAAHAFKSAAGTVHAKTLSGLLAETEAAARSNKVDVAVTLVTRVDEAYQAAARYLDGLRSEIVQ